MSEKVVISEEFRLRLIDLEYKNLSKEEMVVPVQQLYIEEYGENLDADIKIFYSSEATTLDGKSGYDGTAIHFSSNQCNRTLFTF